MKCPYDVCKLVFGVDILDLNFEVQINSVKQPSHCCVGLGPLMIIFITASLSSKMYSIARNRENFAFGWVGTVILFWVCLLDVVIEVLHS